MVSHLCNPLIYDSTAMAEVSFSRGEGLDVLDDWSDSDAGGMSSSEEEALDREIEGNNDSSR